MPTVATNIIRKICNPTSGQNPAWDIPDLLKFLIHTSSFDFTQLVAPDEFDVKSDKLSFWSALSAQNVGY